jgi:RNA polymerase sigma-70 factor, ECF subfamily
MDEDDGDPPLATGSGILSTVPEPAAAASTVWRTDDDRRGGEACAGRRSLDQRRFDALVAPHLSAMRARAGQLCGSNFDADDLLQEALLRAFRASGQLNDRSRARAWALKIVTNVFFDRLRKQRRQPVCVDLEIDLAAPEAVDPSPWDHIGTDEVRAAVGRLPDDVRETYRLFALEGCDYVAISQQQGIPKATVGTRVFRARKLLRALLTAEVSR